MYALAFSICCVACGFKILVPFAANVLAHLLPEGTPLPLITRIVLAFPYLVIGGTGAILVVVSTHVTRGRPLWLQRHFVLILSLAWCALVFLGLLGIAALTIPFMNAFSHLPNYFNVP